MMEQKQPQQGQQEYGKIYIIARMKTQCFGHGDYGSVLTIVTSGDRNNERPLPVFTNKKSAQKYIDDNDIWNADAVEMDVRG
jgi:hypothetical protein